MGIDFISGAVSNHFSSLHSNAVWMERVQSIMINGHQWVGVSVRLAVLHQWQLSQSVHPTSVHTHLTVSFHFADCFHFNKYLPIKKVSFCCCFLLTLTFNICFFAKYINNADHWTAICGFWVFCIFPYGSCPSPPSSYLLVLWFELDYSNWLV